MQKKMTITRAVDLERMDLPDTGRRRRGQPFDLALRCLEELRRPDHLHDRGVLDDVDEQADERRQETTKRLRHDHEGVPADPAEAECGGGFVLLPRNGLDRTARRLGHLRAPPEDERDRARGECVEPETQADGREREEHDEDRHEDRKPSPDLDVEADHCPQWQELDREERPERDPDERASHECDRRQS